MKLKDRIKTYNFWVSLASAIILIINTLGKQFNFSVDEELYNNLFTSFCGILVLLGIIVPPTNTSKDDIDKLNCEINKLNELQDFECSTKKDECEENMQKNTKSQKNNTLQDNENFANSDKNNFTDSKTNLQNLADDFDNNKDISKKE